MRATLIYGAGDVRVEQVPDPAKGHVRPTSNVGNDRPTLLSVAARLLPLIGYSRTLGAVRLIDEVNPVT